MALNLNPVPPSPVPPWHRPVVAPIAQTIIGDDTISLNELTSYLDQTTPKDAEDPTVPYELVLPDGNYSEQTKCLMIPGASIDDTAVWHVSGNFAGFIGLQFDDVHQAINLKWGNGAWHAMGGNALKTDE